jgi:hypothetical protein
MIANLLKSDSASVPGVQPQGPKAEAVTADTGDASHPKDLSIKAAPKTNSVAAAVAASSNDDDELYGVTDIVSFITGSNL